MKSGLEGRNNVRQRGLLRWRNLGLNEVRPGRPEQWAGHPTEVVFRPGLNEVRPGRPEQFELLAPVVGEYDASQ